MPNTAKNSTLLPRFNMNQKQQNIPELRFPEFMGEWNKTSLGDIATFSKGKGISKSDISEDGGIECIRYGELYTEYDEIIEEIVSKTNLDKKGLVFSEYNDVIIPSSGETQLDIATASCVLKSDVALGGDLNIIKTPNNGVFLAFYLNNKKKKDIARFAQGNSVVHLYSKQLALLKIKLPTLSEQQKIATFLTSVDKRIQALEHKKELLEQYKKGVMQKIFSREIRFQPGTVTHHLPLAAEPKTEYNGNNSYPYWEVKVLGKVCTIKKGQQLNRVDLTDEGEYPSISGGIDPSGYTDKWNTEKDTVIISEGGNSCGYVNFINQRFWCGGHCYSLINITNSIDKAFLYQSLKFNQTKIMRLRVGSGLPNVQKKDIEKFKFLVPTLEEQQKIAGFLSAIDTKIEAVTSQIDHSKTFKKGLLQKMFV